MVTRSEWVRVVAASAIVVLLTSLPLILGLLNQTPEMRFSGFVVALNDGHSYVGKMRYGAANPGWSFQLFYTAEPQPGGVLFVLYMALGKLAGTLTGQGGQVSGRLLMWMYHGFRVGAALGLLLVVYRFAAAYLEQGRWRWLAWGIAALGGGLDWVLLAAGQWPMGIYIPEAYTFLMMSLLPHVTLGLALMLGGWLLFLRAVEGESSPLWAGLIWFAMAVTVPFYVAALGVQIAFWLGALTLRDRRIPRRAFGLAAAVTVPAVLVMAYNIWLFATDPVFAAWSAQSQLPTPPIWQVALGYGLLIALAVPALRDQPDGRHLLLLSWPAAAFAMMYLPTAVQRRLLVGAIVPLAVLAVMGIRQQRRMWQVAALLLTLPTTILIVIGGLGTASNVAWRVYIPQERIEAAEWLGGNAPPYSVVLAEEGTANLIPAYAPLTVYHGHQVETNDAAAKRARVDAFFAGDLRPSEREALLAAVDYVWAEGDSALDGLTAIYQRDDITIYEVVR